jgi:prepilin-type N-terminal cleavage/methylation domain-containing protein
LLALREENRILSGKNDIVPRRVLLGSLIDLQRHQALPSQQRGNRNISGLMISIKPILGVKQPLHRERGFTLMELLIVMSIMIILMLIAIPNFISMKA